MSLNSIGLFNPIIAAFDEISWWRKICVDNSAPFSALARVRQVHLHLEWVCIECNIYITQVFLMPEIYTVLG
jgi:hypothetical protein